MIAQMEKVKNTQKDKILFLTLSTFGQTGGIQKVCRTMCKTLSDCAAKEMDLQVLSLCDRTKDVDKRYLRPCRFKGFGYHKFSFAIEAIKRGFGSTIILISHVNLLSIVLPIKLLKPSTRIIMLAHGIEIWRNLPFWKCIFMRKSMRIWSVSNYTAEQLIKKHHIAPERLNVVQNCIDPFFPIPRNFNKPKYLLEKHNLTATQPLLLVITRVTANEQMKGYNQVIACLAGLLEEFPGLCYLIGGATTADEAARLNQLIVKNNLQNHVKLIGFIPDKELIDHYLLADIFILISRKEGFGLVLMEAAACGRPIICGDLDGSRDAVLNGKLGTLLDPQNVNLVQKTIREILRNKNSLNEVMTIQQRCIKHFNYTRYQQKVKQLLNNPKSEIRR